MLHNLHPIAADSHLKIVGQSTLHKLAAVCLLSSTVPSCLALTAAVNAAQAMRLIPRDGSICGGDSSLQQCGASMPSDFCCPKSSTCLPLNNTDTVSIICCPTGQNCRLIRPVVCDVSLQDAGKHPQNQLHTTNLTASLLTCGGGCCPFGFDCQDGNCAMRDDTAAAPSSSKPASVPSSTSGSAASATSKLSSTPAASTSTTNRSSFPAKAVLAGLFPGILLGALLTLLLFCFLHKRKTRSAARRNTIDFGPVSRGISDPIYNPQYSNRTDFLNRRGSGPNTDAKLADPVLPTPSPGSTTFMRSTQRALDQMQTPTRPPRVAKPPSGRTTMVASPLPRVRSLFSKSPSLRSRGSIPRGQRQPLHRKASSGSTETIDVLMPESAVEQRPGQSFPLPTMRHEMGRPRDPERLTTFTTLMEDAGYQREPHKVPRMPDSGGGWRV